MKAMNTETIEHIDNGMDGSQLGSSIAILKSLLADQHVLYIKTRNFHWNLKGPRFHDLHKVFEEHYRLLEIQIDDTAERIRMLGGVSSGMMKEFLDEASLGECPGEIVNGQIATELLIKDHNQMTCFLKAAIQECDKRNNDVGTADFLTSLLRSHEEIAWILRSMRETGA